MKQGQTIGQIRNLLDYQQTVKKDYDVSPYRLEMTEDAKLTVRGLNTTPFKCTQTFHNQAAEKLGTPQRYYNRMLDENPVLLSQNVNAWLRNGGDRHFTLRTFQETGGNTARALLSDRYRIVDHLQVADTIEEVLGNTDGLILKSSGLTEDRLYYKYVFPKVQGEIRKGDAVQAGFIISNSETGLGACSIIPMIYRLVCTNGLVVGIMSTGFRKFHIGKTRRLENDINIYAEEYEDTLLPDKIRAFIETQLSDETFSEYFEAMRKAAEVKAEIDAKTLLERSAKKLGLSESEMKLVLEHYNEDNDRTLYGLANAVTRASQDVEDYTRASELEAMGWTVLNIDSKTWNALNEVA